jgi:hypothetical protein
VTTPPFSTQTDAKRFIVGKIIEQAEREGVPLSPAERHMLSWSESDPDFVPEPALADALENEMPEEAFESKVAGLIRRSYQRDLARDRGTAEVFRAAEAKLREGDHYILILMDRALPSRPRSWWPFVWR